MRLQPQAPFLGGDGPHTNVVMSCRVRLARNIAGFPFVNRANHTQRAEIANLAKTVLLGIGESERMIWVDLHQSPEQDRDLLVERHLISRQLASSDHPRGVAISENESLSIMVNEEDHLRMQMILPGLQLEAVHERLNQLDDAVESRLDYAFAQRWGYLTACPTNVGTGVRLSVMLHLPGLKLSKEIDRVRRAAKDLNLAVRGYYGEGSESAGDFYQISNQITLGKTEDELRRDFHESMVPAIIDYEQQAREMLLRRNRIRIEDRVHRALAALRNARLLGVEEAMRHLSKLRLGIQLRLINDVDVRAVNGLFLQVQEAHLRLHQQDDTLCEDGLLEARATLVRQALAGGSST